MSTTPTETVIAEIVAGDGLALSAAAKLLPSSRGEGTTNPATVWRWATAGTRSDAGRLVKLEAARVGGRWMTSRPALARFVEALTNTSAAPPTKPTDRQRRIEASAARLAAAGA